MDWATPPPPTLPATRGLVSIAVRMSSRVNVKKTLSALLPGILILSGCRAIGQSLQSSLVLWALVLFVRFMLRSAKDTSTPRHFYDHIESCKKRRRHFFITGAASGLGRHLVGAALRRGHYVTASDINLAGLQQVASDEDWDPERTRVGKLDVTQHSEWVVAVKEALDWAGGLDVVLNVAGFLYPYKLQDSDTKHVDLHFDINCKGVAFGTMVAANAMLKQLPVQSRKAAPFAPNLFANHIINISSLGAWGPQSGTALYQGSKAAVRTFSLAARKDYSTAGVFVSVLCPDAIQTPMVDLQLDSKDAAMAFSGPILSVQDVEASIFDPEEGLLRHRPSERVLAGSFSRSLACIADMPFLASTRFVELVETTMRQRGLKKQADIRKQRPSTTKGPKEE